MIDLSIAIITYNHARYIEQALDSILSQKTEYKYEIIIGDDCSTDNTALTIEKYVVQHPNVIKFIKRSSNLGATKNLYDILLRCKGEYLAILDGDDFYTYPEKIQRQVSFLNENKEYQSCAHRLEIVDKYGGHMIYSLSDLALDAPIGQKEFNMYNTDILHLNSLVFRNFFKDNPKQYEIIYKGSSYSVHSILLLLLLEKSDIYVFSTSMTAWRCVKEEGSDNYTSRSITNLGEIYYDRLILYRTEKDRFNKSLKRINFNSLLSKGYLNYIKVLDKSDEYHLKQARSLLTYSELIYTYICFIPVQKLRSCWLRIKKMIKRLVR